MLCNDTDIKAWWLECVYLQRRLKSYSQEFSALTHTHTHTLVPLTWRRSVHSKSHPSYDAGFPQQGGVLLPTLQPQQVQHHTSASDCKSFWIFQGEFRSFSWCEPVRCMKSPVVCKNLRWKRAKTISQLCLISWLKKLTEETRLSARSA